MARRFSQTIKKRITVITSSDIKNAAKNSLISAGTTFRKDQLKTYRAAIKKETNPNARWALEKLLENAAIAEKNRYPLCDDTGIPHVIIEIGNRAKLQENWLQAVQEGIASGLKEMPGRPMAVKGNEVERIEQSKGLYTDPEEVIPAPITVKPISGDGMAITVLLLGGGPEIRAKTYRVFHKRSIDNVLRTASEWLINDVKNLGCTPCVPAIGIGRTHMEASALMLEAMKEGDLLKQSKWEKKITEWINAQKVGPLGLGGSTTALGAFIKIGPARASGVRIVSIRPCCCVEPRRATVVLKNQ
ncbi:MAG TPA: fumarate hydratase [Deltaproteobacteria bacterium]|nr:fumarate hydratase [Deltaproteobacteria bacterium]